MLDHRRYTVEIIVSEFCPKSNKYRSSFTLRSMNRHIFLWLKDRTYSALHIYRGNFSTAHSWHLSFRPHIVMKFCSYVHEFGAYRIVRKQYYVFSLLFPSSDVLLVEMIRSLCSNFYREDSRVFAPKQSDISPFSAGRISVLIFVVSTCSLSYMLVLLYRF